MDAASGLGLVSPARAVQAEGMRGYFAIGVENISKEMNLGNLFRSAHAFGASFVFTVNAAYGRSGARSCRLLGTPGAWVACPETMGFGDAPPTLPRVPEAKGMLRPG